MPPLESAHTRRAPCCAVGGMSTVAWPFSTSTRAMCEPASGKVTVFEAPRGSGPYGIATAPGGSVDNASLAGSDKARVDVENGHATVLIPPTAQQGARRVWADSKGGIWVSEWFAGKVARYEPRDNTRREWALPGERPQPYAGGGGGRGRGGRAGGGAGAGGRGD